MTGKTAHILSMLSGYLSELEEKGYSEKSAGEIITLIFHQNDTPFDRTVRTFGCNEFEAAALALGLLAAVSGKASAAIGRLCGADRGEITPSLVSAMFFASEDILPFADELQPDSALGRLFEGVCPRFDAHMHIRDFVTTFLLGGALYDEAFADPQEESESIIHLSSNEKAVSELKAFLEKTDPARCFVLQLTGERGTGRHTCIRKAFSDTGRVYMPIELDESMKASRIRELSSKLMLADCIPVVNADKGGEELYRQVKRLSDEMGFVITVSEAPAGKMLETADTVCIPLTMPTMTENLLLWQNESKAYKLSPEVELSELSGEFEMTPAAVRKALHIASVLSQGDTLTPADIRNGCYRSFDGDMGEKASKINCIFSWNDLVLPESSKRLLRDACQQVRLRHRIYDGWGFSEKMPYGKGVSMIFTGPPGTGKTMGAQVIAAELGMDIYKINLANAVSKYIGETEKNLNEIFEKAKRCKCILFFDEADVLFSKRTEVRESNDKYSNMESAFLLQKTEEFSGVVILATNLVQNFDEAFKRRMRFIIDFPFPDAALRREMWLRAFPAAAPVGRLDIDFLVEHFQFSGSNIRNIALHSAFLAVSENSPEISMKHIMEAIRNEYAKSGKAFTKAEAGEYYYELSGR